MNPPPGVLLARMVLLSALFLGAGCPTDRRRAAQGGPPDTAIPDRGAARPLPTTHEACARVALPAPGKLKEITLAGVRLLPHGPILKPAPGQQGTRPRLVLGVLADTHQADASNLKQLTRLRLLLEQAGAHGIVVLGGLDATYEGTRAALAALKGKLPVLAMPGEGASRSGFSGAVENLGQGVVDLTLARAVVHPAATLISVPGYHLIHNLRAAEQGCAYEMQDLQEVVALARQQATPRVLLAHGPPRGKGPGAIDRAFGGINAGDPKLTRLLQLGGFSFGLFAHLHESGGRATRADTGKAVPQGTWASSLLINVGSADATPHDDLLGIWSRGNAILVTFHQGRATYRVIDANSSETKRNN